MTVYRENSWARPRLKVYDYAEVAGTEIGVIDRENRDVDILNVRFHGGYMKVHVVWRIRACREKSVLILATKVSARCNHRYAISYNRIDK